MQTQIVQRLRHLQMEWKCETLHMSETILGKLDI
jgi:hypothetical protein